MRGDSKNKKTYLAGDSVDIAWFGSSRLSHLVSSYPSSGVG